MKIYVVSRNRLQVPVNYYILVLSMQSTVCGIAAETTSLELELEQWVAYKILVDHRT